MQRMSSFNPYIFKAFYDWLIDNEITPHLLVNAEVKGYWFLKVMYATERLFCPFLPVP